METAIIIGLISGVIWQSIRIIQNHLMLNKKIKKAERDLDDTSIEWSGFNQEVSLVKKQYPDLIVEDDFRMTVERSEDENENKANRQDKIHH
jgi:hypothetical protein